MDDRGISPQPELMNPDWREHAEKDTWMQAPAPRREQRVFWRRPSMWVVLGLVVLVVAAVTVRQVKGETTNDPAATQPTAVPSTMPGEGKVDLTRPFANTPAALWKDGLDGFESAPVPEKIGSFTPEQVTKAYDQVKQLISAASLDNAMLEKHDPSTLLGLLAPREAARVKEILDAPDKETAASYVTQLATGFRLLPMGPKLKGKLTVKQGESKDELVIHANYVIAYAFFTDKPGSLRGPSDIVAFTRDDNDYLVRVGEDFAKEDHGLAYGGGQSQTFSMACGAAKAGYLAPSYSEINAGDGPGVSNEARIYDIEKPIDNSGPGCE